MYVLWDVRSFYRNSKIIYLLDLDRSLLQLSLHVCLVSVLCSKSQMLSEQLNIQNPHKSGQEVGFPSAAVGSYRILVKPCMNGRGKKGYLSWYV